MTIIAFISQKGGVGKSTLSQALAVEARKQNLGEIPQEASTNLQAPETAPTRLNKINIRTKPLNFKVSEEFY